MSRNSPKQFEQWRAAEGRPLPKPSLQLRIRNEAAKLRAKAQSILAQANGLDEMAAELEPTAPVHRCHCGTELGFEQAAHGDSICCWCPNCRRRSEQDGATVFVYGYGRNNAAAFADWKERLEGF